jgi:hypothetical protein
MRVRVEDLGAVGELAGELAVPEARQLERAIDGLTHGR